MLDGKLTNYNNIKASIERLTDDRVKQKVLEVLNDLSEESLQKIDRYSSIFDFLVLKNIETEYHKNIDLQIKHNLLNKSESELDKITKRKELFNILEPYHSYLLNELWHLNDEQFARVMEEPRFIKALANIGAINQDILGSHGSCLSFFQRGVQKLNQSFDGCMENKDLFLIYSLLLKKACVSNPNYGMNNIIKFIYCSDRESMKNELSNLHQHIQEVLPSNISDEYKIYNEQTFNLMISNSKAIEQILYSDVDGRITRTLVDSDSQKIEKLIHIQALEQNIRKHIPGFKYKEKPLIESTKSGNSPARLENISAVKLMEDKNQEHFVQAYSKKYSKCEEPQKKDIEEKAQQRETELS